LSGANLSGANLLFVLLVLADLTGANLADADLTGANLADADLTGANLEGANLDGVIGADFSGALNVSPKYLKD